MEFLSPDVMSPHVSKMDIPFLKSAVCGAFCRNMTVLVEPVWILAIFRVYQGIAKWPQVGRV